VFDIRSVAFRKLRGTKYTDVIVIGVAPSANGPDNPDYLSRVFIASADGFRFDTALAESESLIGIGTGNIIACASRCSLEKLGAL
jgi:hypothetical protein